MAARNSEIRSYLLRFAAKKGIKVVEYVSDQPDHRVGWFCHLESGTKTATAISYEGHDNALVMAFLNLSDPSCDFLS